MLVGDRFLCALPFMSAVEANRTLLQFGTGSYESLPDSGHYVTNSRQQTLHIQYKPADQPKAIIFFLHGYGSHGSRPPHRYLGEYFTRQSYSYASFDFQGHGRSSGPRGIVQSPDDLVDDGLAVLLEFYQKMSINLPFFIFGHSMGGGTGLLLSYLLSSENPIFTTPYFQENQEFITQNLRNSFRGCVLFCPVIRLKKMSSFVRSLTVGALASIFPSGNIPTAIFNENDYNDTSWADPEYRTYIFDDGYPRNPHGLSYGGNIQFRTLNTLLQLAEINVSILESTSFPWIVFHDPADASVPFDGSELFLSSSLSSDKRIVETPGGLHDIVANQIEEMALKSLAWVVDHC